MMQKTTRRKFIKGSAAIGAATLSGGVFAGKAAAAPVGGAMPVRRAICAEIHVEMSRSLTEMVCRAGPADSSVTQALKTSACPHCGTAIGPDYSAATS